MNQEVKHILNDIEEAFVLVHEFLEKENIDLGGEYKKINYTYFRMFCSHLESLVILTRSNHYSSGILLLRTMLELYVKSYYLEFVAKSRNENVSEFLDDNVKYPSFFKMTEELENYFKKHGKEFSGVFSQFTKRNLASYEKFSFFSHGTGEILKAFYNHDNITFATEQITDVLKTSKGLFVTFSMLLCVVQDKQQILGNLLESYKNV